MSTKRKVSKKTNLHAFTVRVTEQLKQQFQCVCICESEDEIKGLIYKTETNEDGKTDLVSARESFYSKTQKKMVDVEVLPLDSASVEFEVEKVEECDKAYVRHLLAEQRKISRIRKTARQTEKEKKENEARAEENEST